MVLLLIPRAMHSAIPTCQFTLCKIQIDVVHLVSLLRSWDSAVFTGSIARYAYVTSSPIKASYSESWMGFSWERHSSYVASWPLQRIHIRCGFRWGRSMHWTSLHTIWGMSFSYHFCCAAYAMVNLSCAFKMLLSLVSLLAHRQSWVDLGTS